eukprot:Sdes_comp20442_c0_seq6m14620
MMRLRMKKSLMEASFFPKRFASSSSSASSSEANQSSSSARTWKYITFAGIPLILSSVYISFKGEHSHAERGNYPHMNIRRKVVLFDFPHPCTLLPIVPFSILIPTSLFLGAMGTLFCSPTKNWATKKPTLMVLSLSRNLGKSMLFLPESCPILPKIR